MKTMNDETPRDFDAFRSDKAIGAGVRVMLAAHLPDILTGLSELIGNERVTDVIEFAQLPILIGALALALSVSVDLFVHGTAAGQLIRDSVKRVLQG